MSKGCNKILLLSCEKDKHKEKKHKFVGFSLPIISDENIVIQANEKYFVSTYKDTSSIWYNKGFSVTDVFPQFIIVPKDGKYSIKATLTFCQLSSSINSGAPVKVQLLKGKINDDVCFETIVTAYAPQISVDDEDFDQQNVQVHIVVDVKLNKHDTLSLRINNNLSHAIILTTADNASHLSIHKID